MSQARHTGKIVLSVPPPWDRDGTVLVTGGTGALGALAAWHLAGGHGMRHLVLAARSGPAAPGAAGLAAELAGLGAGVTMAACDVADRGAVAGLLAAVPAGRPLTAVVHAAGVLDDGVVTALDEGRLDAVLRPKLDGAWHLHELTAGITPGPAGAVLFRRRAPWAARGRATTPRRTRDWTPWPSTGGPWGCRRCRSRGACGSSPAR